MNRESNEEILDWVEAIGGGCVWEPEVFAVTLLGVELDELGLQRLRRLEGVEQIAIEAANLSFANVESLARIPGLQSLVLRGSPLSEAEIQSLQSIGPEVEVIEE